MCVSCMSSAEALLLGAAGTVAVGRHSVRRAWDARRGRRSSHQRDADDATTEFVAGLGLDPDAVLGSPREHSSA